MTVTVTRKRAKARTAEAAIPIGRAWRAWYRIRLTIQDMNYATRRMAELQAPWISDERRH